MAVGGLFRGIASDVRVRRYVRVAWTTCVDFDHRYYLVFRLLDDPTIDEQWRGDILEFVRENLHAFVHYRVDWYGGPHHVLDSVNQRLRSHDFLVQKKWVYVVNAMAAPDTAARDALLEAHRDSDDPLTREVVEHLTRTFGAMAKTSRSR
jgi:hypothetical protein